MTSEYDAQRVVYHNNGGADLEAVFAQLLRSLANHLDAVGDDKIQIVVINHGSGIDLLKWAVSVEAIRLNLDQLQARGIRFLVCANTLSARNIDRASLHAVSINDVVPAGVAELAKYQSQGFAYIHL